MKILFVSESYYPYQSGVPMVVKYLAEGLAVDNEVTVATSISPTEELPVGDEYPAFSSVAQHSQEGERRFIGYPKFCT